MMVFVFDIPALTNIIEQLLWHLCGIIGYEQSVPVGVCVGFLIYALPSNFNDALYARESDLHGIHSGGADLA